MENKDVPFSIFELNNGLFLRKKNIYWILFSLWSFPLLIYTLTHEFAETCENEGGRTHPAGLGIIKRKGSKKTTTS